MSQEKKASEPAQPSQPAKPTTLMDALHMANENQARNIDYVQQFTFVRMFKLGGGFVRKVVIR